MSESVDGQNESNPELWFSTWAGKPLAYSWFRVLVLKKNTIVAAHTWTGLNVSFVRFYIFIDLDFVSVGKNGPKKELGQYPVPSVGTVAQITYNIRNDWAKQYSPQENSIFGFLYFFCDEVTCRWPLSSHLELTLCQKQFPRNVYGDDPISKTRMSCSRVRISTFALPIIVIGYLPQKFA